MTQMSKCPAPRGRVRCRRRLEQSLAPGFFRALSEPSRLSLLVQLAGCGRPCTVSELAECCPVDISVVSRHLASLRDAGLLESEKRGKAVYYAVRYAQVAESLRAIADAIDGCCPENCCVSAVCIKA